MYRFRTKHSIHDVPKQTQKHARTRTSKGKRSIPTPKPDSLARSCLMYHASCEHSAQSSFNGFSSASKIPLRTSSSGGGRLCRFFSKLSARMWRSSSFWWPWRAGAAFESGRMLPARCGVSYACWRGIGGELGRLTLNQGLAVGTLGKAFLQVVSGALAFEFEGLGLEGAGSGAR